MELSIPYAFTAIDGSRFVLGNSDTAKADPDWIGTLDPDNGITGLLDGADVRPGAALALPQADGLILGPSYLGGRSGTVQGKLDPNVAVATRELYEQKARKALYQMQRADGTMKWTPSAPGSIERMLRVRAVGRPDFRGRHPKTFMLTFASRDQNVVSSAVQRLELTNAVYAPAVFAGDAPTWPWFRVDGPCTKPEFLNYQAPDAPYLWTKATIPALTESEYLILIPERSLMLRGAKTVKGFETTVDGFTVVGASTISIGGPDFRGGGGNSALRVAATAQGGGAGDSIQVVKGRSYDVSGWVRTSVVGRVIRLSVAQAQQPAAAVAATIVGSNAFQRLWVRFTALESGNVSMLFTNDSVGATTFQIDDVSIDINAPVDASGFIDRTQPGPFMLGDAGTGNIVGYNNVQFNAGGITGKTPPAQVYWRHAWR